MNTLMEKDIQNLFELVDEFHYNFSARQFKIIEEGQLVVVGDIHGDLYSLNRVMSAVEPGMKMLFLGDYGDRGNYPVQVYITILKRAVEFPEETVLLRGNHESDIATPHDLPGQLYSIYGDIGMELYLDIKEKVWDHLSFSAMVPEKYWFVHGGVPTKGGKVPGEDRIKLEDLRQPSEVMKLEMLWNDPGEEEKSVFNYNRGVGMIFGYGATEALRNEHGIRTVIRSHEPFKVIKAQQKGMVVTVGSCLEPYGLTKAAFLVLNLDDRPLDGYELEKTARVFSF